MDRYASRAQLHAAGWSWRDIAAAEAAGRLRKVRWGWYEHLDPAANPDSAAKPDPAANPDPLEPRSAPLRANLAAERRFTTALADLLCAAGGEARVAGAAAAHLHGLDGFDDTVPEPLIEVPATCGLRLPGVRRVSTPLRPPVTVAGLATADLEETLLTLGAGMSSRPGCAAARTALRPDELVELAVEDALRGGSTSIGSLEAAVAAVGHRRCGRSVLGAVLARRPAGAPPTESYLETRAVQVLRNGGVPTPQRQVELRDAGGRFMARVDLLLGRLVIECDGYLAHHRPTELGLDRERTNRLHALGYVVVRFTFEQIEHQPAAVLDVVTRLHAAPRRLRRPRPVTERAR